MHMENQRTDFVQKLGLEGLSNVCFFNITIRRSCKNYLNRLVNLNGTKAGANLAYA